MQTLGMRKVLAVLIAMGFGLNSQSAPPVPVQFLIQHDHAANIDQFSGGNYVAPHDNLIPSSAPA